MTESRVSVGKVGESVLSEGEEADLSSKFSHLSITGEAREQDDDAMSIE